jgi:hypothetical protein
MYRNIRFKYFIKMKTLLPIIIKKKSADNF